MNSKPSTDVSELTERYISALVIRSKEYREKISNSKTRIKAKYYTKKLKRNSKELNKAIAAYSALKKIGEK